MVFGRGSAITTLDIKAVTWPSPTNCTAGHYRAKLGAEPAGWRWGGGRGGFASMKDDDGKVLVENFTMGIETVDRRF